MENINLMTHVLTYEAKVTAAVILVKDPLNSIALVKQQLHVHQRKSKDNCSAHKCKSARAGKMFYVTIFYLSVCCKVVDGLPLSTAAHSQCSNNTVVLSVLQASVNLAQCGCLCAPTER